METALNNIAENFKNYIISYFYSEKKITKSNSISYLEYKLDKFFKKEKQFLKNRILIYYEFNKNIFDLPVIPYYLSLFYNNLDYIVYCIKYSPWDEIMEIYKNIVKTNPNYKNSRLADPKHVYDRRYLLFIIYYIFVSVVYLLSHNLYKFISNNFYFFIDTLETMDDANFTFLLAIIYMYLITGVYYGGIPFIIFIIKIIFYAIYYLLMFIYYFLYFIGLILYYLAVGISSPFVGGGNKNNKKTKLVGGNIYNDFDNYINSVKETFDEQTAEILITIVSTILSYILPNSKTVTNVLDTPCKSTSNIEKMLSKHNNSRNTEESININTKVNRTIKSILPEDIQNNEFIKCMYKEAPKKPDKCDD